MSVDVTPGSGKTVAASIVGGEEVQEVKLLLGADTVGVNASVNNGAADTGTQRVAVAAVAHDAVDSGNPVKVGGKAYTTLPTAVANLDRANLTVTTQGGALVAGVDGTTPRNIAVNASGQLEVDLSAQQGAALSVDLGANNDVVLNAGSALVGDVGLGVRTSGGTSIFRSLDLDETEEEVKATAGQVYWIHAMNVSIAPRYLKFYNATAASVTVGTTTPVLTFMLPGNNDSDGAGFVLTVPNGIVFSTAITVAATSGLADADTSAPNLNEIILNMGYA